MPAELAQWIPAADIIAVMLDLHRSLRQQFESRMDRLEARLREDMKRLDERVARLEHSQAKLEGLREAITHRSVA